MSTKYLVKVIVFSLINFSSALTSESVAQVSPLELRQEFEKFTKIFSLPEGLNKRNLTFRYSDIDRVINSEKARICIEKYELSFLAVPKKYIVEEEGSLSVFAERVESDKGDRILTLTEIQQLVTFAEQTGFRNWKDNIIFSNGKINFIDTKDESFLYGRSPEPNVFTPRSKALYVYNIPDYPMTPEALAWFSQYRKDVLNSEDGKLELLPLPRSKIFDERLGFNCEHVKKWREILREFETPKATEYCANKHLEEARKKVIESCKNLIREQEYKITELEINTLKEKINKLQEQEESLEKKLRYKRYLEKEARKKLSNESYIVKVYRKLEEAYNLSTKEFIDQELRDSQIKKEIEDQIKKEIEDQKKDKRNSQRFRLFIKGSLLVSLFAALAGCSYMLYAA